MMSTSHIYNFITTYRCYDCVKSLVEVVKSVPQHLTENVENIIKAVQCSDSNNGNYTHKVLFIIIIINIMPDLF
jgi:hypothetical protein